MCTSVTRTARCLDMGYHDHDTTCFVTTMTVGTLTVTMPNALACDECHAQPDEPCRPDCTALASLMIAAEDAVTS